MSATAPDMLPERAPQAGEARTIVVAAPPSVIEQW